MGNQSGGSRGHTADREQETDGGKRRQTERESSELRQRNHPEEESNRQDRHGSHRDQPEGQSGSQGSRGVGSRESTDVENAGVREKSGENRDGGSEYARVKDEPRGWSSGDVHSLRREREDDSGTLRRNDGRAIRFEIADEILRGRLRKPPDPSGIVVLVSGSCGVAQAPKEVELVDYLFENGVASLTFDLLTPTEASDRNTRRDIDMLSERLAIVTDWMTEREETGSLNVGYYGTDTGGPAVLQFLRYSTVSARAVALYNARPDLSTTVPSVPVFCAVDETKEFLMEINERFYERIKGNQAHSEFLRADEGSSVPQQMAHWFEDSFHPGRGEGTGKI